MVIGYIRTSTLTQDLNNQKFEIMNFAQKDGITINDFIEIEMSSRKDTKKRRIDELLSKLSTGDTLIVSELSRIGRSTHEVIGIINGLVKGNIRLIAVKQGLDIKGDQDMQSKVMVTLLALFSELERDLISSRTIEALKAKKAAGVRLGRPLGSLGKSKLDDKTDKIRELLSFQVSKSAISRILGCSRTTVHDYIKSRGIGL